MAAAEVSDCNGMEFEGKAKNGTDQCEAVEDLKRDMEECGGGKDDSTDGSYEFIDDHESDETVVEVDRDGESGGSFHKKVAEDEGIQVEMDGELHEEVGNGGVGWDLDGSRKVEEPRREEAGVSESEKVSGSNQGASNQVKRDALDAVQGDANDVVQLPCAGKEDEAEVRDADIGEKCVEKSDNNNALEEKPSVEVVAKIKESIELHDGTCTEGSESNKLEGSVVGEDQTDVVDSVQAPENAEVKEESAPATAATVTEIVGSDVAPAFEDDNLSINSNGHSQVSENPSDTKFDQEAQAEERSGRGHEVESEEQCRAISTCNSCAESQVGASDVSSAKSANITCALDDGEKASDDNDNVVSCPSNEAALENNTESVPINNSTLAQDGLSEGKDLDYEAEIRSLENVKTIPDRDADEVVLGDTVKNISSEDEVSCTVEEAESRYLATKALILKWGDNCDDTEIASTEGKSPETSFPKNTEELKTEDNPIKVEHSEDSAAKSSEHNSKEVDSKEASKEKETLSSKLPDVGSSAVPEQIVDSDIKRLPCYMIRVPKFFDDKLMAQKEDLELQVNEKTQSRDSIKIMLQNKKDTCDDYSRKLDAARKEEKAVRDLLNAKRNEIDAIQNTINKMKNATSIDEIDDKINSLEHRIQHETIPLKEEKQILREIKTLKQSREKISSSLGPETEVVEAFVQKDQIERKFEHLKQELSSLRSKLIQVEAQTKGIKKKYDDECQSMRDLFAQRNAANNLRQETYSQLWSVKKEYFEKNARFYQYKDDRRAADQYAYSGDIESLRRHCASQVEKIMELWNKNDEFRNQYVKFNMSSTARRFRTLDARSLGPGEAPTVLPNARVDNRKSTLPPSKTQVSIPLKAKHEKTSDHVALEMTVQQPSNKVTTEGRLDKIQKPLKFFPEATVAVTDTTESVSKAGELEKGIDEVELTKKANETARQEELRQEKAAAEIKEKIRLEQMTKAKEAEERKRRKAEKAKAKAEFKARRDAEVKEKKKAKKQSRKEKKMADLRSVENPSVEADSFPNSSTSQPETAQQPEARDTTASKRPSKTPVSAKQINKVKPLPPPLRNRRKRRMQSWMWMVLAAVIVLLLFLAGNYVSFSKFNLPHFGY